MRILSNRIHLRGRMTAAHIAGFGLAIVAMGCSDLTKVHAPDVVQRPALTNANGAVTFFNGAQRQMYSAFQTIALSAGYWGDEIISAGGGSVYADNRAYPEGSVLILVQGYGSTQAARLQQLQAISVVQQIIPSQRWRIGQLYANMAYLETYLAELFCSGMPLSTINPDFTPNMGGPLTTAQMYDRAKQDFDSALVYSTDSARILNMAIVGRARVLLDLGQVAAAGTAVASVPTSFVYFSEHTATINPNTFFTNYNNGQTTIADKKGTNGLNYVSANDPRLPTVLFRKGGDGTTNVYRPTSVSSLAVNIVITNGIEARLIEAEAALAANDAVTWLAKLNNLRATQITPAMPALADPGTAAGRVDLQFREKAFWLWGTAHRAADMRRLIRQYSRPWDTVFPIGGYVYGAGFSNEVAIPFDFTEVQYNPLLNGKQCLDPPTTP